MIDTLLELYALKKSCLEQAAHNLPESKKVGVVWIQLIKGARVLYDYDKKAFTKLVYSKDKTEKTIDL